MDAPSFRESATNAIGYWERRRLVYNAVLAAIVLAYFAISYPASKSVLTINHALVFFMMAVLANVAYCAVYLIDIFAQLTAYREPWRKYRWVVFLIGMLFAGIITRFFSMGLFQLD
ncbi:MAG: hypothetical protein ABSA32_02930 [Candidatus Acidiferrales bacterium]|jgi:TRAP-type uncharacterized transport system fused permease subunit